MSRRQHTRRTISLLVVFAMFCLMATGGEELTNVKSQRNGRDQRVRVEAILPGYNPEDYLIFFGKRKKHKVKYIFVF